MASLLQVLDMASYEIIGGKNLQVFVMLNDPDKLRQIAENPNYRNGILTGIERKHRRAVSIMNSFMGNEISDEERWEIIEQYFLGNDEYIDTVLDIKDKY